MTSFEESWMTLRREDDLKYDGSESRYACGMAGGEYGGGVWKCWWWCTDLKLVICAFTFSVSLVQVPLTPGSGMEQIRVWLSLYLAMESGDIKCEFVS